MKLKSFEVTNYKCIDSSGQIDFEQQIAFVGKNEAGKTAVISALYKLNPVYQEDCKFILEDYPRKNLSAYKKSHEEKPDNAISAVFKLEQNEIEALENLFGKGVLPSDNIKITKSYESSTRKYSIEPNENVYIKHLVDKHGIKGEELSNKLKKLQTLDDVRETIKSLEDPVKAANKLIEKINELREGELILSIIDSIDEFLPKFFLFDDYSILPGKISLRELQRFENNENVEDTSGMRTALALMNLAGAKLDDFMSPDNYERLKADLEASSNSITDQLKRYWSQNKHLEIEFDLKDKVDSNGQVIDTILHVRVRNTKHRVTVPFDDRSKGFVWFFSFLVAFSDYKDRKGKIILLLDEPGLNLHGKAQEDLLKYFDNELSKVHQLAYTTHSPFLIKLSKLERVRPVEDTDEGTKVFNDPFKGNSETRFPLQAAMGFNLTQTLYIAPDTLLVEGVSDIWYLKLASQLIENHYSDKTYLSNKWAIIPVGGVDKIPPFLSLMRGNDLRVAIFMDVSNGHKQKVNNILKSKLLKKSSIKTVGDILGTGVKADIEDLFTDTSYLNLINKSYHNELKECVVGINDVQGHDPRITKRVEKYFQQNNINGGKLNHYKPAYDLGTNPEWQVEIFDEITISNFSKAFAAINQVLEHSVNNPLFHPAQITNKEVTSSIH